MVSSVRQVISSILLVLSIAVSVQTQTTTQKVASASISGKVTIKGKPAVGVMVVATDSRDHGMSNTRRYRARTDQTGSYRLTNLPAGTYEISAVTPALVSANQLSSIVVSDGEEIEDVNLLLVPGGVITGKITDSEGEPIIGAAVWINPVFDQVQQLNRTQMMRLHIDNVTDDRGVYRAFGLAPGKYKVSAGESGSGRKTSREYYKHTFFPSVTDDAKATIIEVTEGSETNNVDIVMGRPVQTFSVAGRVIDGETGRPVSNLKYGVGQKIVHDQNSTSYSSSTSGEATNANGEFRLENVTPGKYTIFTVAQDGDDMPPTSVTFDVVDRDVTDLLIKTINGSSLSGVVVFDGNEGSPALLNSLRIGASVESKDSAFTNSPSTAVGQDGTFSLKGVRSGPTRLWVYSGDKRKQFEIVRVERNGVPSETINVKERDLVAGLRVLVKYVKLTGTIRGQIKVEDGELPPISQLSVTLWPLDENLQPKRTHSLETSPQLDARGRFSSEGLPAGTYELTLSLFASPQKIGPNRVVSSTKQQVTVSDDTVTEVTLIIKPQPIPD